MSRFIPLLLCVLTCALLGVPASADDPPKKLSAEERKQLEEQRMELNTAGFKAYQANEYGDAQKALEQSLAVARRLYPNADFPDGHANLSNSLNNLGFLHQAQGKYATAEALLKEALDTKKRLFKGDHTSVAIGLNNLAALYQDQGNLANAEPLYEESLAMCKRLFKDDHVDVARSLGNLGALYQHRGQLDKAEPLLKEALAITGRLFKGDHPKLALAMNNLGVLYRDRGQLADAEPLYAEALAMYKRLFKDDHPNVALALNNLAALYNAQSKYADAEPLYKEALAMCKRLFKGDHPNVARGLHNLGFLYLSQKKLTDAEPLCKDALTMYKRCSRDDHPDVARALNSLAVLYRAQGSYAAAEPLFKDALAMYKRLFKGDHPEVALGLNNLGFLYLSQGKHSAAESLLKDALAMSRRRIVVFAAQRAEGEALTLASSLPLYRDSFLSIDPSGESGAAGVYSELWADKGAVARVYEQRQHQARVSATDPRVAKLMAELVATRRRRAEKLLAPEVKDAVTRQKREEDIKELETKIADLDRALRPLLSTVARADKLANVTPDELQKTLTADAAVVDIIRCTLFEFDKNTPGIAGETQTACYLAFVVTKDKVAWVDLDTAANIEPAVTAWREAITGGKDIPAALPAKVRELVWDKVRKELPATIKTVYVCPDAALCRVPWGALPGDKPGTILLEDFAVATIPHAPFLLDKLWPQDPLKNPPTGALVVGGVKYDAELAPPAPNAVASRSGDPLVKPGAKLGWSYLPGTAAEATGVFGAATAKKLPVTALKDEQATAPAVLEALPKAKYAHFATHGFFADPSFRSIFQLDPKDYEQSMRGERIGRAANSPLVMTGLVFAGANNPKTPGRGIVTGESLIDLDLSGLELAVLSACETGLGDVAGGEGTFGLQRAFHMAGTRDVVASLWKVPDQSTAALMALFYRNLWDKNLSPMEALRQAQLTIYRDPGAIPELAKGFRGKFLEVPGAGGEVDIKPGKDGKAHPLLWAAFTLSGPGR